ncbi:hypothetical protein ACIA58_25845 [Kribbella sp. NPDC051586]|uniref:hypothetical protein n=1 Tax=Kribbella sp. NPDC051586 TaxID=3364118 RepID=UPI00379F99B5
MPTYRWIWRTISGLLIACGAAAGAIIVPLAVWVALGLLVAVLWLASQVRDSATDDAKPSPLWNARLVIACYLGAIANAGTTELCRQWLESYGELRRATSQAARLRVVMARQRCLDELERRDPDGLQAWLASTASAGGDPRRFFPDSGR